MYGVTYIKNRNKKKRKNRKCCFFYDDKMYGGSPGWKKAGEWGVEDDY